MYMDTKKHTSLSTINSQYLKNALLTYIHTTVQSFDPA